MFFTKKIKEELKLAKLEFDTKLNILELEIENLNKEISELTKKMALVSESAAKWDMVSKDILHEYDKKNGDEPYIKVLSEEFSKDKGIGLALEWNPAMIKYLRSNGYSAIDEDEIIEKYVADIFKMRAYNNVG